MALSMTFRGRFIYCLPRSHISVLPVRYRWKPPDKDENVYPSFATRLAEWNSRYETPASTGVNIGFYYNKLKDPDKNLKILKDWSISRKQLEATARTKTLNVDINAIKKSWLSEAMPDHVCRAASHYGVFRDLFDGAHFYPVIPLGVSFDYDEEFVTPVNYGNEIPASEAAVKPFVSYEAEEDSLWTLIMTSPDGNIAANDKELLHWFVGNIPGSSIDQGHTVCDFLRPFPARGAGFLRYVFVLYRQSQRLDFNKWQRPENCLSLKERTFSTLDFYREHEDQLTPAGLAFFQSEWDQSVRSVFHHTLDMKEPRFEFIHPPPFRKEQEAFPHKNPFNVYLDMYRDVKDIQEEVLKEKLKLVDISQPLVRPKYPAIDKVSWDVPSWMRCKMTDMQLGKNQWKYLYKDRE